MNRELRRHPHRRQNPLTGDWVLVSPHRTQRPWQGEVLPPPTGQRPAYDPDCYLCPGNLRAGGVRNPHFENTMVFDNDFPALVDVPGGGAQRRGVFCMRPEGGRCRVLTFSPRHDLTLAALDQTALGHVVDAWCNETLFLSRDRSIHSVLIFENKGALMGNSNPHPHGQIWAQTSLPDLLRREGARQRAFARKNGRGLLSVCLEQEEEEGERLVWSNASFAIVVPFWAVWPYETLLIPRRPMASLVEMGAEERLDLAAALATLTRAYDRLFGVSFPYSAGIHQAPVNTPYQEYWHWHMHFFPPLLRSASVRKYMVGYEMLAEPQRDICPEDSAARLRQRVAEVVETAP